MAKFKIGDKVRVKPVKVGVYEDEAFVDDMVELIGAVGTISSVIDLGRRYKIETAAGNDVGWNFQEDWLELVEEAVEPREGSTHFIPDFTDKRGRVWEVFSDQYYFDMICVRHKEDRRFDSPLSFHFPAMEQAKQFCTLLQVAS